MRLVALEDIQGEEILARNITGIDGRTLLSKGIRIKLSYLNKLNELGISKVYIDDAISEGIEISDVLCDETRTVAKTVIQNEMKRYLKRKEVDTQEIQKMADIIMKEVLSNKTGLINLKDLKIKDEYTFSHSVNTCVLSVLLASRMGMEPERVKSIGAGSLLHDFGKMLVPAEILNKPGKLTEKEFEEMKKHPLYGYEALKNDVLTSPSTKVVVLMHHERLDGSGYPNGLRGEKIHDSAKICSICDVFDAMTSDRQYRKALSISDAVEFLYSTAGIYFEKSFVDEFLKHIPIYPEGTIVLLNNGLIGIVLKNNKSNLIRPVIRFLINPSTQIKYTNYVVNMMEDLTLKIEREIRIDVKTYNKL